MSSPALDPFVFVCICHFHSVPSRCVPQASDDPRRACRTWSAFHLPPAEALCRTLVPWISKRSGRTSQRSGLKTGRFQLKGLALSSHRNSLVGCFLYPFG